MASEGRQAYADGQEPELHGDHAGVLGILRRGRRPRGVDRVGHARTAARASPDRSAAWGTGRRRPASETCRSGCADARTDRRGPVPRGRGRRARTRRRRRRGGPVHARVGRADAVRQLRDPPVDVPRGHRAARARRQPQPHGRGVVQRLHRTRSTRGGREREGDGRGRGARPALPRPGTEGGRPPGRSVLRGHGGVVARGARRDRLPVDRALSRRGSSRRGRSRRPPPSSASRTPKGRCAGRPGRWRRSPR